MKYGFIAASHETSNKVYRNAVPDECSLQSHPDGHHVRHPSQPSPKAPSYYQYTFDHGRIFIEWWVSFAGSVLSMDGWMVTFGLVLVLSIIRSQLPRWRRLVMILADYLVE